MKMADSEWIYDISAHGHGGFKRRRITFFWHFLFILFANIN